MSRRAAAFLTAAFLALPLTVAQPAAAQTAAPPDKVAFLMDWIPTGEHAAYYSGWQRGTFAKHGIDVTITRGYGSGDTVTKVASGSAQFGVADMAAVLTARMRADVPVKSIMAIYTYSPHSLFVLKSSGITSFKGLEGKKIAITPGNSHKFYFPEVARRAGTDPDKITWVNTDASAMASMLISKRVDAAPFYAIHEYYINKAAEKAGEHIVALPFVQTGFTIYAASIMTTDAILTKNPGLVKRFSAAVEESFAWARDNQVEACKLHIQRNPEVEQDDCEHSLARVVEYVFNPIQQKAGTGKFDPEELAFTWKVVAESQDLDVKKDYKAAVDTTNLP
jgi:NitT/TauT family transport system substrate-binding protein